MPDIAREKSNKILEEIEERITKEYEQARKEIDERLSKHLERFAVKDAEKRTALKTGEITKKEYRQWRSNQFLTGKKWEDLRDTIAKDLVNKQAIAKSITNGYMPEVYALNHNFIAESVSEELDFKITFSLYNKNTVENLMKHNDILPPPGKRMNAKFARGEAIRWERGQIQSVAMQSILQGESIPKMSKRIAQTLSVRNRADSIRYARTACTGAENKGRLDGMQNLSDDGIVLDKQWTATGDDRTRQSHLDIDGESVPPNEPFSNGLMYPGDPAGSADEVWNCRCSMGSVVAGFRRKDGSISKVNYKREDDQHDREIAAERERRKQEGDSQQQQRASTTEIGNRPERPRKYNFDSDEAYQKAREQYKEALGGYEARADQVRTAWLEEQRNYASTDAFRNWAESNGLRVEQAFYDNVDPRLFDEIIQTQNEMFARFPEVRAYQDQFYPYGFDFQNTGEYLMEAARGLNFGREFSNAEYVYDTVISQQTEGYLTVGDGTLSTVIRHEYGHNADSYIRNKFTTLDSTYEDKISGLEERRFAARREYEDELIKITNQYGSEYSKTNTAEAFAEGFAEYASNPNSEYGKTFGEFFERWYYADDIQ